MKRSKRRAERDGEQRTNGNVIPLHAGFRDSSPSRDERGSYEREAPDEGAARHAGARSSEHLKSDRSSANPSSEPHAGRASDNPSPELDDDPFEVRDFFASTPKAIAPSGEPWLDFDGDNEAPHSPAHHRGMFWTLGIAGAGLLLIGLFLLYNKVLMPTPEEFAIKRPIKLPTPDMLASSAGQVGNAAQPAPAQPAPTQPPPVQALSVQADEPAPSAQLAPVQAAELVPPAAADEAVLAEPVALVSPAVEPGSAAAASDVGEGNAEYASVLADARKLGFRKPAEDLYLKALALNPGGAEAVSGLAMLYLNQGKNPQAKERAEQAIALNQASDEGWIVLGAAESAMGKERLAREAYARCAALPAGKYVSECKRLAP